VETLTHNKIRPKLTGRRISRKLLSIKIVNRQEETLVKLRTTVPRKADLDPRAKGSERWMFRPGSYAEAHRQKKAPRTLRKQTGRTPEENWKGTAVNNPGFWAMGK